MTERRQRRDTRTSLQRLVKAIHGLTKAQIQLRRAVEASLQHQAVPVVYPAACECAELERQIGEALNL